MTFQILPPITSVWEEVIDRRHAPPQSEARFGYQEFRQCLRWEFGFTCAFCLCHEADLTLHGIEGTGLTGIEHFVPVSVDPARANDYDNCFYACRFCNQDRGTLANADPGTGARLLDPCAVAWGDFFSRNGDELTARPDDENAYYTHQAYNLDHPRKVLMRRFRRETFQVYLEVLEKGQETHEKLIDRAIETADPYLLTEAQTLANLVRIAYNFLVRYPILPVDRQPRCLCGDPSLYSIPEQLASQAVNIEPPRL